jgi:putative endonuclease
MARHNDFGRQGEQTAVTYLQRRGYRILETNWRYGKAEIDILAEKDGFLVVVEVKTRSSDYFGAPENFVNRKKILLLTEAVNEYIRQKNLNLEIRFDIVSIVKNRSGEEIKHIRDAFYWF